MRYGRWHTFLVGMLSLLLAQPVCAQYEFNAWRFGRNAGLLFPATPASGPPQPAGSQLFAIEGCASIADSAGNLLLYTNAEQVYSRSGSQLAGGQLGSGGSNAVQGALLLKHPGPAHQYLLFKVDEAQNLFVGGLRYTTIEMAPDGLTGNLLFSLPQLLTPAGYLVTEAMTAIRHANGADYWVVVHGYLNREFLSYHITEAGPDPVPVRSVAGSYHGFTNPGCSMRGSPDGRQLAVGRASGGVELLDFDNQTGQVANSRSVPLPLTWNCYGLEFSPDNSLLYVAYGGSSIYQADLRRGTLATQVASGRFGALQRGPDNRIYVATYQAEYVGAITAPNTPGPGCGFVAKAVNVSGQCLYGLPNFANQPSRPLRLIGPLDMCVGMDATFSAEGLVVDSTLPEWDFGDPTAGVSNRTTGSPVRHRYLLPGTYQVNVMVPTTFGLVHRTQQVRVNALPALRLMPRGDTTLCYGEGLTLHASPQPGGTTYRWQDGSTGPTLTVQQPGRYALEIRNAAGCTAHDSLLVRGTACTLLPNIITPNGDALNQTFVLAGLNAVNWSIRIFNRWGTQVFYQVQYDNSWSAAGQTAGLYFYLLTNSQTGAQRKGWVEVRR